MAVGCSSFYVLSREGVSLLGWGPEWAHIDLGHDRRHGLHGEASNINNNLYSTLRERYIVFILQRDITGF
jgi:hypothetical protein